MSVVVLVIAAVYCVNKVYQAETVFFIELGLGVQKALTYSQSPENALSFLGTKSWNFHPSSNYCNQYSNSAVYYSVVEIQLWVSKSSKFPNPPIPFKKLGPRNVWFLWKYQKSAYFLFNLPQIQILPQDPGSQDPNVLWTLPTQEFPSQLH